MPSTGRRSIPAGRSCCPVSGRSSPPAAELPGVHRITVYPNCVARENRYDVLIVLDMASEALPVYDASAPHRLWKEEFGPLLAQKAIFDFEP